MRILPTLIAAMGVITATAASAAPPAQNAKGEAELAKLLAGRVAGPPTDCISEPLSEGSQIIDGTAIVYRQGATLYVNRPQVGADLLDSDDVLVTKLFGSQLCRMDTIQLYDRMSHIPKGFVGLGDFVPYKKPRTR